MKTPLISQPPKTPVNRTEEDLKKLDQIAQESAVFAKSVSLKPSVEPLQSNFASDSSAPQHVAPTKVANQTPVIESQAQLNALVESDFTMSVTVRNARTYKFMRVLISPSLTEVWGKNTRASEPEPDVTDIIDSILSNGTNLIPAFGQFDNDTKKVQVIAGSRRRFATLKANVFLTLDLYFGVLHEKDKHILMQVENIRRDPDAFLQCRSYKELVEPSSGDAMFDSQEALGKFLGFTRVHTNHLIMIGRLPSSIVGKITDRQSITLDRAHNFAKKFFSLKKLDETDFQSFLDEVDSLKKFRFVELDKILKKYFTEDSAQVKQPKPKVTKSYNADNGLRILEMRSGSSNNKAIELPDVDDRTFNEILALIKAKLDK